MSKVDPVVFYHGPSCWDGFCAAWLFSKAYPNATFVPSQYGSETEPLTCSGRDVFILDFCFSLETMHRIASEAASLTVIDHHKTAQKLLTTPEFLDHYHWDVFAMRNPPARRGLRGKVIFDMTKSGGQLAWEYLLTNNLLPMEFVGFFDQANPPWLVAYTGDRDLWKFALPNSKEINAYIRSFPLAFDRWDIFHQAVLTSERGVDIVKQGAAILRREAQIVSDAVYHAREVTFAGHKVLAVNATVLFSDVAGELAKDRPFGVVYFIRTDNQVQWSLRSRTAGEDVSKIAELFGGGGHPHSAGLESSLSFLVDTLGSSDDRK